MAPAKEWQKFKVEKPGSGWGCQKLTLVGHVAHVPVALRIAEDEKLRADLIFDESKLNTHRIRVVWLSPNDWEGAGGFRYGNVRFKYDWLKLVDGKRYYWVESIAYGIVACRILVTDNDWSAQLEEYDPKQGDGPWWLAPNGVHYWNGNHTLEIMFEGDLALADATYVDFVTHNPSKCCNDYKTCPYCGTEKGDGGAEFLAALTARRPKYSLPGIVRTNAEGDAIPSSALELAVWCLQKRCGKMKPTTWGNVAYGDANAPPLARALLSALGNPAVGDDAMPLLSQFKSLVDAQVSIGLLIGSAVGLSDPMILGRDLLPSDPKPF